MSYLKEFKAALSRTKKWKIGDGTSSESVCTIDQTILNALEGTCHIPFPERAGNAMSVNFGMFHMLVKKFRLPGATITMGNVAVNGEMRMPITHPQLKTILADETGEESMGQYHLWTTLPGGMVLDHVIMSSLHRDGIVEINELIPAERYIYGQGDDLPHGLTYHPLITGLEFFVASGTIDPEAMAYLMGEDFAKQYD
ncbi:MAG: hypothetical protein OCC46_03510 [Pseudodesulfovibrio sp.]